MKRCLIELAAKKTKSFLGINEAPNFKRGNKAELPDIVRALENLGIGKSDVLMVHTALSSINAAPSEVVSALKLLVGDEGTIVMPTHPALIPTEDGIPLYDPEHCKSTVGYLTEYFRNLPDVKRSTHPFSSVAVWGDHASWLLEGEFPNDSPLPHGYDSPYHRFARLGGKSICIGVTAASRATINHVAEEVLDSKFQLDIFTEKCVKLRKDKEIVIHSFRKADLEFTKIYKCKQKIHYDWNRWGIIQKRAINGVPVEVVDAKKCVTLMSKSIRNGSTYYPFCPKKYYRNSSYKP